MNVFLKSLALFFIFFLLPLSAQSNTKSIFASYGSIPDRVYEKEIFPVVIKLIITRGGYDNISTSLSDTKNYILLNPNSKWSKEPGSSHFSNTFYVQATKTSPFLTGFMIELKNGGENIEVAILQKEKIESIKLKSDAKFSGVLAKNIVVKSYTTNRFDENSNILTVAIEATLSNLNDFNLTTPIKNSVTHFANNITHQKIEYSAVLPHYDRVLEFTYFNTNKNSFELVKVPLELRSDDISTHIDINPKENIFKLYKDILLGLIAVLLILLFIKKSYKFAIILAFIILIYLIYANNPFNTIKLEKNTVVRILPNDKLTVFYITEKDGMVVEKLDEKEGYIKILLPSGRIGWVKKESVVKN